MINDRLVMSTSTTQNPSSSQPLEDWQIRARARKQKQLDSIPAEWKISVPEDRQNVIRVPYECGLLTALELEITDTINVGIILDKLRTGEWTSVLVTSAFYKRALVAHQTAS
jgi:amidase